MRQCIEIQPKWLIEIAPHYYQSREIEVGDGGIAKKKK
jgi:pre-mRNA-splicing factor ATP-dependent RNA helicase DHX16